MKIREKKVDSTVAPITDPNFKPVLVDNLEVKPLKEDERGKMFILREPNSSNYIKVHESVLSVLKNFDGTKSIEDISRIIKDAKLPLDAHELISLLAEEGFIANLPSAKTEKKGDIFSFEIKLFTITERHMAFLRRLFFFVKSRVFQIFYAIFLALGFSFFVYNFPYIFPIVIAVFNPEGPLSPLLISIATFYLVEIAHELAHALLYYNYGGRSAEIGIEFHFFIPFFYTLTPDAIWMETRKQIWIFLAGPLTSLFFAEVFTFLTIFENTLRSVWAAHAFFWHISALVTLTPIIKTDGYFIVQALTKFPNLLEHGVDTLVKTFQMMIGRISPKEFKEHLSQYSATEKKVLKLYLPLFPVVTCILIYVFVFTALQFNIIGVLALTPKVMSGAVQGVKPYVVWALYVSSIIFSFIGITGTIINTLRRLGHGKQDGIVPRGEA
jgi:hypothetical protein